MGACTLFGTTLLFWRSSDEFSFIFIHGCDLKIGYVQISLPFTFRSFQVIRGFSATNGSWKRSTRSLNSDFYFYFFNFLFSV